MKKPRPSGRGSSLRKLFSASAAFFILAAPCFGGEGTVAEDFQQAKEAALGDIRWKHIQKGFEQYPQSEAPQAKEECNKCLAIDPQNKPAVFRILKNLDEEEAVFFAPQEPYCDMIKEIYFSGLASYRAGDYLRALKKWERGLKLVPTHKKLLEFHGKAQKLLGIRRGKSGKEKKAAAVSMPVITRETIKKEEAPPAEAVKPAPPEESKQVPDAPKKDLKKAEELYRKALIAYKKGDLQEAQRLWEQVLQIDPDSRKTRRNMEKVKAEISGGR